MRKGTYAAVRFSAETLAAIDKYLKDNKVPNPLPIKKMHATLLYSKKYCPEYKPLSAIKPTWDGDVYDFDIFATRPTDPKEEPTNCLVMKFSCGELSARHEILMEDHNATYDFPMYTPHITLSYDVGDLDTLTLPEFTVPIEIVEEYGEDLDLDWAKTGSK